MLTSPLFGILGDRGRRPRLIGAGVALWSIATALGGFAGRFATLFAARSTVGVGEAAYGTIAPALLADSLPAGAARAGLRRLLRRHPDRLGGGLHPGRPRRSALRLAGGLLRRRRPRASPSPGSRRACPTRRAAARTWLRRPLERRTPRRSAPTLPPRTALGSYAELLRNAPLPPDRPRLRRLHLRARRPRLLDAGLPRAGARRCRPPMPRCSSAPSSSSPASSAPSSAAGSAIACCRAFGRATSGSRGWRRSPPRRWPWSPSWRPHGPSTWRAIVVAELLLFISTGPHQLGDRQRRGAGQRATAVALSILAIHLLGDVPSPPLIGILSDATLARTGLPRPPRRDRRGRPRLALRRLARRAARGGLIRAHQVRPPSSTTP